MSRRDVLVVLGAVVASVVVVAAAGASIDRGYTASATLVPARSSVPATSVTGVHLDSRYLRAHDPEAALDTSTAWRNAVAGHVAHRLGDVSPTSVARHVGLDVQHDPLAVKVTGGDASPQGAARIANAFAREYVRLDRAHFFERVQRAETMTSLKIAIARLARQGAGARRALAEQRQALRVLHALGPRRIRLVRPARAQQASLSLHLARDLRVAAVLGLLVGLGVVFFPRALGSGKPRVLTSADA